jgi:SNF2 family DNA or RNA helicase
VSAKFDAFRDLVEEIVSEGHRILVFSQFVRMLQIIREWLEGRGIAYEYLDGRTRDRQAHVRRFQQDEGIPLFLISLKAGGTGLNLTGADYVIHYDPWWNPAVEDQATDRAHRIGQTRNVLVYRLITRGTVEEKILDLQDRKRDLADGLLGVDRALGKVLTREDVEDLFRLEG